MFDALTRQDLLDAIPSPTAILRDCGRIVAVNRAWMRFAAEGGGGTDSHYIGCDYLAVCGGAEGDASTMAIAEGLRAVLGGAESFRCEYACDTPTERRWVELLASPMQTIEGRLVLVMHNDLTRRRRQQNDLRKSHDDSAALAALVASSSDAIISYDLDGVIRTWNRAATRLYGYQPEEIVGRSMEVLYPPDWPLRITDYRDRIIAEGNLQTEVVRRGMSGELRDIAVSGAPVRSPGGEVVAILNIHRDITSQKAAREHLNFVTRELSHRAKNLLAVVLSIERQTARGAPSVEEFRERFEGRIRSLATSIDLLASQNWGRVWMDRLARSQLAIFADLRRDEVRLGGPRAMLHADAVEAVGMSLHELGTNALKHGALGASAGSIRLTWSLERAGDADRLRIEWDERCPAIQGPPGRLGFGHAVVTRLTEQKLGATVRMDFTPGRLCWSTTIPPQHFTAG